LKSQLLYSINTIPIEEILKCKNIGVSSGASAPEILVKEFIAKIKERADIEINEVEIVKENVVFKIPNKLT
jgi:4-hydroxy-3-methylbut-2-enyl diphosphate reductase